MQDPPRWYPPVADQQAGTFTPAQARAAGAHPRSVSYWVASGRWVRVAGRGLRVARRPATHSMLLWAIELTWPDAIVCRALAARHWGAPIAVPEVIDVVVPSHRRPLHRLRPLRVELPPGDVVRGGTLAITDQRRSIVDALAHLPIDEARDLLAWSVTHRRITVPDLAAHVVRHPGRWGNAQLRRLAREARNGALSVAEQRCHLLFRQAGTRGWVANARIRDRSGIIGVADVLFEAERVVVEIDGRRAHGDAEFQSDRDRRNRMVAAGYEILQITWDDLTRRPGYVVTLIGSRLRARASLRR